VSTSVGANAEIVAVGAGAADGAGELGDGEQPLARSARTVTAAAT